MARHVRGARRRREPERPLVQRLVLEIGAGFVQRAPHVRQRESGPPCAIVRGRGSAGREVSAYQLDQRLVAVHGRCGRDPLLEQRVRELLSPPRPAADQRVQLRVHEDVGEPLRQRGRDAGGGESGGGDRRRRGRVPGRGDLRRHTASG